MALAHKNAPLSAEAREPEPSMTRRPIGEVFSRIKASFLVFVFGSAADVLSTWRCWTTLNPHQGHEANLIVVAFVRLLGLPAGLVGCKIVAAVVVLASSVILGRLFPRNVTDYRLAETLFVALGCIYLAAGAWNAFGLAYSR